LRPLSFFVSSKVDRATVQAHAPAHAPSTAALDESGADLPGEPGLCEVDDAIEIAEKIDI
jgi:hypothetical protein